MRVLVECYPDEMVLEALGVPKTRLLHLGGKGEVVKRVHKLGCAIGMIDEDPNSTQPRDLSNYSDTEMAEGLRLCTRDDDPNQRLVIVCPRLEEWLYERAEAMGIRPEAYNLPDTPDRLHNIPRYEQRDNFRRFLTQLVDQDQCMGVLRQWVRSPENKRESPGLD